MKSKKSKLFLSVSTLMLCFGVMCFGVFAASTVTYNLSGNISYELDDVFVDVDTTQYVSKMSELPRAQGNVMQDMQDIKESIENGTELPTERVEQLSYLDHQTTYNNGGVDTETNVFENESPLDIRLGSYKTGEKGYVNIIAVTVTNYANAVINAQMDLSAVTASDNVDIIQLNQIDDVPSAVDGAPSKATFCFAVILQDELTAIPSLEFTGAKLSVSKGSLDERQSSGFTFEKLTSEDGTATGYAIVGYSGSDENLIIPSYHQEEGDAEPLPVIQLGKSGSNVFYGNTNIKTVYIPDTVKNYVGNDLFKYCSSMEFIYIPEGAETYPSLESCMSLISVNIPNSITKDYPSIPTGAFLYLRALKYINFNKLTSISSSRSLSYCSALETLCLDSMLRVSWDPGTNSVLKHIYFSDNLEYFYGSPFVHTQVEELVFKNPNAEVSYLGSISTLKRVTLGLREIGSRIIGTSGGSSKVSLEKVTFLNTVEIIGDNAFSACSNLSGPLTIPSSVESIGNSAFSGCSSLSGTLVIPDTVTSIGQQCFANCSSLTKIELGSGITELSVGAFSGCNKVTEIVLSEGLTQIGIYSLSMNGLKTITIPKSVTTISSSAFGSNVEQLIFLDQENEWSGGADKTITTEQLKDSQYLADLMCRDDRNTTWNKVQVTG